jgi:hypothetical protein
LKSDSVFKINFPYEEKTEPFNKSGAMLFFFPVSIIRNFTVVDAKVATSSITIKIIIAMKTNLIAAVIAIAAFSSCSVYRSGQTPDDVYYSPGRAKEQAAYVEANGDRDDGKRYNNQPTYNGYDNYATPDDRWLMMRVRNRSRWSYFDDYNYYSPYNSFGYNGFGGYGSYGFGYQPGFSFGLGFGSYYDPFGYSMFNNYYNWNSYYNPYYPKVVVVNPKTDPGAYNRIRNFNLNSYSNRTYNNNRSIMRPNGRANGYNNSNSTLGNTFRRVFSNSNTTTAPRPSRSNEDYYRSSDNRPVRTYSPSSSSSNNSTYSPSSSGSSSGGSGSSGGSSGGSRPSRR